MRPISPLSRMLRLATPMAVVLVMFLQAAASAATAEVSIKDNFFDPAATKVKIGDSVHWTWAGIHNHSTTSDATMPISWDSTIKLTGDFSRLFTAAGKFTYHCNVHSSMHGAVSVAPKVSPTGGPSGTLFKITFSSVAIDGMGLTALVQKQDPGGSFVNFISKSTGVAVKWDSTGAAPGTYRFRVILKSATKTSLASPAKSVTVS